MKKLFKFGFWALAISVSVAACNNTPKQEETHEVEAPATPEVAPEAAPVDGAMTPSTDGTTPAPADKK